MYFKLPLLITLPFLISLNCQLIQSQPSPKPNTTTSWIRAGFWSSDRNFPISSINSSSFTHLLCSFSTVDPSTFRISISPSDAQSFSNFTSTVRYKNPSITTLVSIRCNTTTFGTFSSILANSSARGSFINSSIEFARTHGFQGLDLVWSCPVNPNPTAVGIGELFDRWRDAIEREGSKSGNDTLLLTATLSFWPIPVGSVNRSLDWVHLRASEYRTPKSEESATAAHAAVYDPAGGGTDAGVKEWIGKGLPASKMVLAVPLYGYAWKLRPATADGVGVKEVGSPAEGAAVTGNGFFRYVDVRRFVESNKARVYYNGSYVVNYCSVGLTWIGYDDVEAVRAKVDYARRMGLRGYAIWQIPYDDNGSLSQVAAASSTTQIIPHNEEMKQPKKRSRVALYVILPIIIGLVLGCGVALLYLRKRRRSARSIEPSTRKGDMDAASIFAGEIEEKNPRMVVVPYSFAELERATDDFSMANKLGQGGYGPVYKGVLTDGTEIAVKKLSRNSSQGDEEFKNEVILTAQLQHVNLVRVLGFCIDGGERMLVYEYLPGKSLDQYLFDSVKRLVLDWGKRAEIIEGITQGLLYLHEYSGRSIVHRDLKPANVLLDFDMKAKISDFGMARILNRDSSEANTEWIAGTRAYCPPEYLKEGQYSKKSDVYSFGILLLQIISGKRCVPCYGPHQDLELHVYAYELWKEGKGREIMDPLLDDSNSSCKLMNCLRIALLCVQRKPRDRPRMREVSSMLRDDDSAIENDGIKDVRAFMNSAPSSVDRDPLHNRTDSPNRVTITELEARW